jgi:anaerobic selenocysteine-containing dehydrogenase
MSDTRIVHGTCHHDCPDSCGWQVTVDGTGATAHAVQLRGNPLHPFSKGELCPKVNRFLDRVYSPDRILRPLLICAGPLRGDPWRRHSPRSPPASAIIVNWREASPYVAGNNRSIMFGDRLAPPGSRHRRAGARYAGAATTNGSGRGLDPSELVHSRLIILWGTNTRLTNRHLWPVIEEARAAGAQVIVIDPLRTITAESADWFLQPLPGTDVALMLAMMHVLIRDDLVDQEWVAAHTVGFEDLAAHVADWTPARAAAATGLSVADIERLATLYGTIRPAAIRTLIGAEHHEHGAMFFRTLTCLPALVGAWRDQGGGFARSVGVWSSAVTDDDALSRPDLIAGRDTRSVWMPHLGRLLTDTAEPIRSVLFVAVNAMVSVPNTELVRRGLERDDLFTVVHDQYLTDTARYADIVLPATTHIESVDVVPSWGHLYLGWNEPAIAPCGEAVSNSELHRRLARAMGFTEPALFEDDLTALRAALPTTDLDDCGPTGSRGAVPADGRPSPTAASPLGREGWSCVATRWLRWASRRSRPTRRLARQRSRRASRSR